MPFGHNETVRPPLFHVVMHEPEIPNNTGNIGRTCIATGCALHLIKPLGFDTSEKALRRAGLDYWPRLNVREHDNWASYLSASFDPPHPASRTPHPARWFTSGLFGIPLWQADLRPGDHLVFGKETRGLPAEMLEAHRDRVITLPMVPDERGLNVATAVCAVVYEGIRQCVARGEVAVNADGRLV
jgi:tRNA (cytidine/uridine-2'-O-)-methyltransferase